MPEQQPAGHARTETRRGRVSRYLFARAVAKVTCGRRRLPETTAVHRIALSNASHRGTVEGDGHFILATSASAAMVSPTLSRRGRDIAERRTGASA